MSLFNYREDANLTVSRWVSEAERGLEPPFDASDLTPETRARFADHALSVNRPDVAAEFMSATPVERAA